MPKTYRHIFFDLDRTLWDFDRNSRETLEEIFVHQKLTEEGIPSFEIFYKIYHEINAHYWENYRLGNLDKETLRYIRFYDTLTRFGIDNKGLAIRIGNDYVDHSPRKTSLLPGTLEILEYLQGKYTLHIITNGFEEVQHIKMHSSGIAHYFEHIITSERAGHKKPTPEIFRYALKLAGAKRNESIMIGDHLEIDCVGARQTGIDAVYFNPGKIPHGEKIKYEITSLEELKNFL
ncbi:MAG: Pyrimidine 5'-nucleotidase YjjG [Bacteroidia bacterium]|nr:Pyrimidine 5'-nucleotidase YjjG [Bacteroidia bacterium]